MPGQTAGRYQRFALALRDNPDAWAVLPSEYTSADAAKAAASNIRSGKVKGFEPKGAFTTAIDGVTIYVKYIGDSAEA